MATRPWATYVKSCPPKQDGFGHHPAVQGGTHTNYSECCVFIPDESANVIAFIKSHEDAREALSDLTPSLGQLTND